MNLWGFLAVVVIGGMLFSAFTMYLSHQKEIKKMEIDAQPDQKKLEDA